MHHGFGALAKKVTAVIASPWALVVALALIAAYFVFGPAIGLPPQPLELSFLITLSTFILVFLIQHETYRDSAATQVKLDELISALDADRAKIGIEERSPKEIDSIRESTRKSEGQRTVG
ncbi:MAG: low affinity iron permease family protein [Chloroflexota bacterium]|nr:low affinity iron permease family protein [Chloroflexota bacterium]